jgi:protein involved in polysaccharide export with SLBB domain
MQRRIHGIVLALTVCAIVLLHQVWAQDTLPAAPVDAAPTTASAPAEAPAPPVSDAPAPGEGVIQPVPASPDATTVEDTQESTLTVAAPSPLPIFGRDLFDTAGATFEPNVDTPVPPDYILGAGDTLTILCWNGSTEYERSDVQVSPSGDVYLKLLGSVSLAQKTLTQAESELRQRYARLYKQFTLRVQVVGRRSIPVYVVGEVRSPGKYMLSSLSTVFTALYAAKGPTDIGSLRSIRLVRSQKVLKEIDVYDYLLKGQMVDLTLKSGDTVYVPIAGKVITVAGEVRRPARYELLNESTLKDAIALAGGTTSDSANRLRLTRVGDDHKRQVRDLQLPADGALPLQDGDELQVMKVLAAVRNAVHLQGAVNRPGAYPHEKATTVAALIALAEGLTLDAYTEQAVITRQDENTIHTKITVNLRKVLSGEAGANVDLLPGDIVRVYKRTELAELLDTVHITGEVVKPGTYPYQPDMRIADLIRLAFGPTTNAYLTQAYLYRHPAARMPQVVSVDLTKALAGDETANAPLAPRDRLVIYSRQNVVSLAVAIAGEVHKPGSYAFFEGMRVSDAIFLAGGVKPDVALDRALLTRLNESTYQEEIIEISLRDALAHVPTADILLENRDRLVIYPVSQLGEHRIVTIEGAVIAPGTYPFTGGMRVSHLLFLAKGMQRDAYATRANIFRTREDNTVEVIPVDLAKASTGVLTNENPILTPRDRLVVATREEREELPIVKIDGYVRTPGSYPLTVGMRLSDLLDISGGLKPEALHEVKIYRQNGESVDINTFTIDMSSGRPMLPVDPMLQTKDLVSVLGNSQYVSVTETVSVTGEVRNPGAYPAFAEGIKNKPVTLYELLTQAGGTLDESYPAGIMLYRRQSATHTVRQLDALNATMRQLDAFAGLVKPNVTPEQEAAKAQTVEQLTQSLAKVMMTDKGDTAVLIIPPRSMQAQEFSASIPINAEAVLNSKGAKGDIVLEPGDTVFVPKRPTTVTLIGGVTNNASVIHRQGERLKYYLDQVGGVSRDGDEKRTVVMRMNGTILPLRNVKAIEPGDIIIIPTKYIVRLVNTRNGFERFLRVLSESALSFLPFRN